MARLTTKSTDGTSYYGINITTSVSQLERVIGEAQYISNDGRNKTNFDWECETNEGDVFTIYDWKEYRPISKDELIIFHIGAKSESVSKIAKNELEQLLS
jgi:hypothetical protein